MSLAKTFALVSAALLSGSVLLAFAHEGLGREAERIRKGDLEAPAGCRQANPRPGSCIGHLRGCFVVSETRGLNASVLVRIAVQCPSRSIVEVATLFRTRRSARPIG
jgi:hypothetical protein